LLDTTIAFNGLAVSGLLGAGHRPGYETEPLNGGSFYDCYRTRDGRYLAVAGLEPKFWEGFCEAIGRPDLALYGYNVWDAAVQQRLKKRNPAGDRHADAGRMAGGLCRTRRVR
ncbi:CoA transferase, partial [Rhodothermus marinus]|uniref:CoA transferase n=1 Tax=Rhodothermus marinus TaxID=29549 RepID=UPI000A44C0E5